ncbi:MAG TPA: phosphate signaling complex protein PhoU [Thermomicrobiaceae bacterium]|nr:phosphate signaling complex protein PhoU [Thermomicrobiaceae bacterium]
MRAPTPARAHYERQLQVLREDLLKLGGMTREAVGRSVDALRRNDTELASAVIADDRKIDGRTYALEEQALLLLATQQPLATDLRSIAATLFIIGELERIGDYAEGIAKIALLLADQAPIKPLVDIPRMAERSTDMLDRALVAFLQRDLQTCREIWRQDDEVDALYDQVYRELLTYMLSDPATIERATRLIWAAHNLERIADRVTNICERTAFVITGNPRELGPQREVD